MHKYYLLLLFVLLNGITLLAQNPPETDWDKYYGAFWSDEANDIIQNRSGGLTFVGSTKGIFKTKKDVYLVALDAKGKIVFQQTDIARAEDEVANAIVQTLDGGYAIVGYTESPAKGYQGKRDAWLVKTDEKGDVLWDRLLGSAEDDEFHDIAEDENGNLIACGYRGNNAYLVRFNALGNLAGKEKIYRAEYSQELTAISLTKDNGFILTGIAKPKKNRVKSILLKTDENGTKIWEQTKASDDFIGYDVIEDKKGNFIMAGAARIVQDNLLLQAVDANGQQIWAKEYGDRGNDVAYSVIQAFDGDYYVVGESYSHQRGAHRPKIWLSRFDNRGKEVWEERQFFGGKYRDVGNSLLQMQDGSLVLAGYSASDRADHRDAVIRKFRSQGLPQVGAANIRMHGQAFVEVGGNNNGTLEHKERGYYKFYLTNDGANDAYNIIANIKKSPQLQNDIGYFPQLQIGHIAAGKTRLVSIPISGNKKQATTQHRFSVSFTAANGTRITPFDFDLESRAKPLPRLVIENVQFKEAVTYRGKTNQLSLQIRNTGDKTAKQVRLSFRLPYKVEQIGEKVIDLGTISPNESKSFDLVFRPLNTYLDELIAINCFVVDGSGIYSDEEQATIAVEEEQIVVEVPKLQDFTRIYWKTPDPNEIGTYKIFERNPNKKLKLIAISSKPLEEKHFSVFINGQDFTNGRKFDKVRLAPAPDNVDNAGKEYQYTFIYDCTLEQGDNRIQVFVENEAGKASVEPININYEPEKPNLYLLAIGVPSSKGDLQFTQKDATDVAAAYRSQMGTFFNNVYTKVLNSKETTTIDNLRKSIGRVVFDSPGGLTEKDMLIVYISSHGLIKSNDGRFKIQASDFDLIDLENTALDFEDNIYKQIDNLTCQKIVLVDACQKILPMKEYIKSLKENNHTRNFKTDPSYTLAGVMEEYKDIWGINSCSRGETSFEDAAWRNGAFTEALLEAFQDPKLDNNENGELNINELYRFLQVRVPNIVATKSGLKAGETQTPYMPTAQRNGQLPVFYFGKKQ